MNQQQRDLNEKIGYRTKCNEWKELKMSGDISAICEITNRSNTTISKAVNHGTGSLYVLRLVSRYYENRREQIPSATKYFSAGKTRRNELI